MNAKKIIRRFFRYSALGVSLVVVFIFVCNLTVHFGSRNYIYDNVEDASVATVAIIPGAAIFENGALSSIFLDRVDTALTLYNSGKVSKILVSGDNGTEDHNEVNPVRLYLMSKGVPDEDIFLDHAGFDTYSTMYRARDIFEVRSALISTQSFHLPRSIFIARRLGIDAYGVNADVGHFLFRNKVREMVANEKAILNLIFKRKPKFTGGKILITGDGRNFL